MSRHSQVAQLLEYAHAQGFDRATINRDRRSVHLACSACVALAINGIATHETGCRNQTFECKGCGNTVPRRGMYCGDCS